MIGKKNLGAFQSLTKMRMRTIILFSELLVTVELFGTPYHSTEWSVMLDYSTLQSRISREERFALLGLTTGKYPPGLDKKDQRKLGNNSKTPGMLEVSYFFYCF